MYLSIFSLNFYINSFRIISYLLFAMCMTSTNVNGSGYHRSTVGATFCFSTICSLDFWTNPTAATRFASRTSS